MKSFIKDNGSLVKQNDNKVKVYHSLADAETALANGEIAEGEVVTTEFVDGATDIAETNNLISDAIALLNDRVDQIEGGESGLSEKISSSATSTNKCPSASEVTSSITNAVNALDVATIGDSTTYVKNITEENGKISAVTGTMPTFSLVGDVLTITTGA